MKEDLFTELRESAKKAIEKKGKPEYWDTLVEALRESAVSGHYRLELRGKLFNSQRAYDDPTKMMEDILKNQDLYAANLRRNNLKVEIRTQINFLPADSFVDKGQYFAEVHLKIDWG